MSNYLPNRNINPVVKNHKSSYITNSKCTETGNSYIMNAYKGDEKNKRFGERVCNDGNI